MRLCENTLSRPVQEEVPRLHGIGASQYLPGTPSVNGPTSPPVMGEAGANARQHALKGNEKRAEHAYARIRVGQINANPKICSLFNVALARSTQKENA